MNETVCDKCDDVWHIVCNINIRIASWNNVKAKYRKMKWLNGCHSRFCKRVFMCMCCGDGGLLSFFIQWSNNSLSFRIVFSLEMDNGNRLIVAHLKYVLVYLLTSFSFKFTFFTSIFSIQLRNRLFEFLFNYWNEKIEISHLNKHSDLLL